MKNMKTFQKLLLAFGGMLVLFFILLVICYSGFKTMISARNSVLHANQVSDSLNEIHLELLRGRADFRDLIIDEIEPSTEPVRAGFASIQVKLDAFEELTADNPDHQAAIEILQRQYRDWLHALSPVFSRPAGELMSEQELRTFILSDPGEELFESMRATLERIHRNEENLLKQHSGEMQKLESYTGIILGGGGVLIILLGGFLSSVVALSITRPLSQITAYARRIARGEYGFPLEIDQRDEIGALARELRTFQKSMVEKTRVTEAIASGDLTPSVRLAGENDTLGNSINRMTAALRQAREQTEITDWGKSGLNELAARAQGETDAKHLANKVLSFLAPYLNAQIATLYLLDEDGRLVLRGGYAVEPEQLEEKRIKPGQGLVGQAASEQRIISVPSVPENYLHISSSVGAAPPKNLVALPFVHQGKLIGVMEIGSFETFAEYVIDFLQTAAESLAVAFDSINHQTRMKNLLEQTRNQAQQLQEQQEELQTANEELEEHSQTLQQSEDELKQQREELQVVNEELEEKNEALEKQKTLIQEKNRDLDRTWKDLKRKAAELEESSRYKSEFLANMSHELRTPLNSLLLLSRSLKENTSGALSEDDIEAAGIIYKNGTDLLNLINDILDLSKIEAGKLNIKLHPVRPAEVGGSILMDFKHLAEEKGISLDFSMEDDLPSSIHTDRQRLEQILRNLVSNAVKFTQKGGVKLRVFQPNGSAGLKDFDPSATVAFEVKDTGIGIPTEKQHAIFEAFQQADGGTSRRFGGTGLGLTIARQLAHLLGGEVTLASDGQTGTTFTLDIPVQNSSPADITAEKPEPAVPSSPQEDSPLSEKESIPPEPVPIPDDRKSLAEDDRVMLIIEDDTEFAKVLMKLCRSKGFKSVVTTTGEEGLILADQVMPTGILLDIRLPGISGWTVLNTLKNNHRTRHIPVHIVSVNEDLHEALDLGAVGFLTKPVAQEDLEKAFGKIESVAEKKVKKLLLVEDNAELRKGICKLLKELEVEVTEAETGEQAFQAVGSDMFDCMILDIGLADMNGFELLRKIENVPDLCVPPVIVYTGKELTRKEANELRKYSETIIVKGARSEERLLDEATLFLHRMVSTLPRSKQRMILDLHNRDSALKGKKVLIVDDDMRNLFALSKVLTDTGLQVLKAEDGETALEILEENPETDLVFMDIMMPGIDGYKTIERIRGQKRFTRLPIIALTAKAMKEDREKCIEAGANDYLAKPVDVDKMISMMRVWLYRK